MKTSTCWKKESVCWRPCSMSPVWNQQERTTSDSDGQSVSVMDSQCQWWTVSDTQSVLYSHCVTCIHSALLEDMDSAGVGDTSISFISVFEQSSFTVDIYISQLLKHKNIYDFLNGRLHLYNNTTIHKIHLHKYNIYSFIFPPQQTNRAAPLCHSATVQLMLTHTDTDERSACTVLVHPLVDSLRHSWSLTPEILGFKGKIWKKFQTSDVSEVSIL